MADRSPQELLGPMDRWLIVMEAFLDQHEWGVRDLARHCGLPRSAVHRMLTDMRRTGLIIEVSQTKRFRPGPRWLRLATAMPARLPFTSSGRQVMAELAKESGEVVILIAYDPQRRQVFAVDAVGVAYTRDLFWASSQKYSMSRLGAGGKAILAFLPEEESALLLDGLLDPVSGENPAGRAELRAQLAEAALQGYTWSVSERYPGMAEIAAPVFEADGKIAGSLMVVVPEHRAGYRADTAWGSLVRAAASRLSRMLGQQTPLPAAVVHVPQC